MENHHGSILGIAALCLAVGCACASPGSRPSDDTSAPPSAAPSGDEGGADTAQSPMPTEMKIRVGSTTLIATLQDNETTSAFKEMLPLTLTMGDLHANEKYADLPRALPTSASNPGMIHAGDVMLYGSRTLVLFYETFSASYSYTRIGKVDDVSGLTAALGSGAVTVRFDP